MIAPVIVLPCAIASVLCVMTFARQPWIEIVKLLLLNFAATGLVAGFGPHLEFETVPYFTIGSYMTMIVAIAVAFAAKGSENRRSYTIAKVGVLFASAVLHGCVGLNCYRLIFELLRALAGAS